MRDIDAQKPRLKPVIKVNELALQLKVRLLPLTAFLCKSVFSKGLLNAVQEIFIFVKFIIDRG